jgi:hypothetical protein
VKEKVKKPSWESERKIETLVVRRKIEQEEESGVEIKFGGDEVKKEKKKI